MKRNTSFFYRTCLGLSMFCAIISGGCGRTALPVVKVTGKVTFNGAPLEEASIAFSPTTSEGREASGVTDVNGNFLLITQGATTNGCLPGSYRVTVCKSIPVDRRGNPIVFVVTDDPDAPLPVGLASGEIPKMKPLIPEKYNNADTSELTVEVTKRGQNSFVFELTK